MTNSSLKPTLADNAIVIIALCCLVVIFEGIDLQAPGLTIPVLGPLFHMTSGARGLFLSVSTFGLILGAAVGGRLSDVIGRKWVLIGAVGLFGLLTVVTAFSVSAQMLLVARFLTGVGLGGALPNAVALVSETVGIQRRGTAVGCLYASLPVGGAVASVVVAIASGKEQWPTVYLVGGIAPLVVVPLLAWLLPNRKSASKKTSSLPPSSVVAALFSEKRLLRTLALWISFFLALVTMYLLLGWLPSLMVGLGLTRPQASMVQIAFNALGAAGSIATGLLLDRYRRTLIVATAFALALACIAFLASISPVFTIAVLAGGLVGATVSATQAILYSLAPGCYPVRVRGTGVGFAVAVGRTGSAVGPLLAGFLIGAGQSSSQVLTVLLPILAVSGVAALVVTVLVQREDAVSPEVI
jgi:MFS transporter, AAHS family, 3-hydroxyphenylpropionic acid transporter